MIIIKSDIWIISHYSGRGVSRRRPRGPGLNLKMLKKNNNPKPSSITTRNSILSCWTLSPTMPVIWSQCFFWKAVSTSYLHICIFSFQQKINNHLKILTTIIWIMIWWFWHCYFILRWNALFFTFLFSTRKRLVRFHFSSCKMFGRIAKKKTPIKFSIPPIFFLDMAHFR